MSPVLPFDVISLIVDIIGETKDKNSLKELSLVSHCFVQICRKHLFATVKLHSAHSQLKLASSKRGFAKLLKSTPDVINYIRELTYEVCDETGSDDHLVSPMILSNFLPTVSRLNYLRITASHRDWNRLDSSMTSAFLHLMHLPTVNHIDLSYIANFPLSSFTLSVNLLRLDLDNALWGGGGYFFDENLKSGMAESMPKIREFRTSYSTHLTKKLLHAKRQDGQPAFNFMDLRRVSLSFDHPEDEQNIRYLLQNAKLLEKLRLKVFSEQSIVGILSLNGCTLKVLHLSVCLHNGGSLTGLCEELEAMAGHNMLEALSLEIFITTIYHIHHTVDFVGSKIQEVENVLVKPGWSALRQVSLELPLPRGGKCVELKEALQSLPDKYLSHLPKLESVAFNYSVYVE